MGPGVLLGRALGAPADLPDLMQQIGRGGRSWAAVGAFPPPFPGSARAAPIWSLKVPELAPGLW